MVKDREWQEVLEASRECAATLVHMSQRSLLSNEERRRGLVQAERLQTALADYGKELVSHGLDARVPPQGSGEA